MKKLHTGALAGTAAAALAAALLQQPAMAAPSANPPDQSTGHGHSAAHRKDNRPGPLTQKQNALRQAAVSRLIEGKAKLKKQADGGSTVTLPGGDSVYFFDNKSQARVLTMLSDFSDVKHNNIPEPDRSEDNSTTWTKDFNQAHYEQMFDGDGESFKNFYSQLSGGRYNVDDTVEDWVSVPGTQASYGANDVENDGGAWKFIGDTGDSWYAQQKAAGKSDADINAYLAQFDKWDRYDYDGDGNYNEPDGYIDHFQAIHAGEGEEAGATPDAIWSSRWYVNGTDFGKTGPSVDGTPNLMGGARIGNSNYYIGDYTVEPENGGLGVFAHEYGHDLGLPDFYDTAGGDNGTGFWTLMSAGSWLSHGGTDGIGTTPGLMGPDERMFLGWLNYRTVDPGQKDSFTLSPAAAGPNVKDGTTQAVVVNLPDKTTTTQYVAPKSGSYEWWSGRGDGVNNTMTKDITATGTITVDASAWYSIEDSYDYLYAEYSDDGGKTWNQLGSFTGASNGWVPEHFTYTATGPTQFRFRYQTDGGVNKEGAFLDDITIAADGTNVLTDGAENGEGAWTVDGWSIIDGSNSVTTPQYYLLENRQYVGYDKTLATGPYNFSEAVTRPNWVEFFPYQEGMLVWYADKAYADNNTSAHPGHGQALPVDARPEPFKFNDGTIPGNRRQPYDATFGLERTQGICLHKQIATGHKYRTARACQDASPALPIFDDSDVNAYWSKKNPLGSTKVAGVGVRAVVTSQDGDYLTVSVTNPAQ